MGIIPTLREQKDAGGGVPSSSLSRADAQAARGPECLAILFICERVPGPAGKRSTEVLVHVISSLTRPTRCCLPSRAGPGGLAPLAARRPCMSVGPCPCLSLNLAVPWTQESGCVLAPGAEGRETGIERGRAHQPGVHVGAS